MYEHDGITKPPKEQRATILVDACATRERQHQYYAQISMGMRRTPEQQRAVNATEAVIRQLDEQIAALQEMNDKRQNDPAK